VEWRQRAEEVGLTPGRVVSVTGHSRRVTPSDPQAMFDSLSSPDGLTAQASTFGQSEVVKEVAAALPEGGTRDEIEALAETFLHTRDVVPILLGRDVERSDSVDGLSLDNPEATDEATNGQKRTLGD